MADPTHACRSCGGVFPATAEFFYRAGRYLNWECRPCCIARAGEARRKKFNRPGFRELDCVVCGARFVTSHRAPLMGCSYKCRYILKNRAVQQRTLDAKRALDRKCQWCGTAIAPKAHLRTRFCSESCSQKAHQQTRRYRRRLPRDTEGSTGLVSLIDIAERDKWRCGLCAARVDRKLMHPDPMCSSLDHLVPVAFGGSNGPENLQLTHLRCNLQKGAAARLRRRLIPF